MVKIVVSDEQAELISSSRDSIAICDRRGRCLGVLSTVDTPERIAEMQRRLTIDEPSYSTAEVLAYLDSLDPT